MIKEKIRIARKELMGQIRKVNCKFEIEILKKNKN